MKKWITTYILFVGFLLFSLTGMANRPPEKAAVKKDVTSFSKKVKSFYFKISLNNDQPGNNCPDEVCSSVYTIHHAGVSQVVPLLAGECLPVICTTGQSTTVKGAATQVPNGYLLHLFPSHYFW